MCIIIDANSAGLVCQSPLSAAAEAVIAWINNGGRVVFGGKLTKELVRSRTIEKWLLGLYRAGKAIRVSDEAINTELETMSGICHCTSNDAHIVALARASGARLLFSADRDLHKDFCNQQFLRKPGGSVYQSVDHRHLLNDKTCKS